ncbi:unnamed protein product [Cochlearia groenlandica]
MVVISSSEAAEEVLKSHDLGCCCRPKTVATGKLSYGFKDISFAQYDEEEEVGLMVEKVSESASKHCPVDLSKTFFSLTASIICRVALGQNFNERGFVIQKDKVEELVSDALLALGQKAVDSSADIVALLLDRMDKQEAKDYFKLNIDNIKGVLMDIFLAGVDTGAITMIWAMTELARNPRVMKKAQEKIRATLGFNRETITEEDIDKVGYLKLIIKETFKLHPPLPFLLPRETMSHVKIQGYDIPPKTHIQLNVWTIGPDPRRWTDPESFIPEKFANSSVDFRGQSFELLPFGSGRRMCPGMPMAIATVELGLLNLLYFFDWKLPEGMIGEDEIDMEEAGNLTIVKKQPLMLVPIRSTPLMSLRS